MLTTFCSPSRYTQGRNATLSLGREMTILGLSGPALLVASKSAAALLSETWQQALGSVGIPFQTVLFGGECSAAEVGRLVQEARALGARVLIGAGGGKVIDAARAAAEELKLPVVSCPTVASSDAPCSALSIIYNEQGVFEECRIFRRNPDLVLVDTQVIARSPARLLVSGMGDALATYFEAKTCVDAGIRNMRGGASTLSAMALAELCYRTLLADGAAALEAARSQTVTPALDRIVEANTLLSGLGFESAGLAAAHAVHNGMTAAPETRAFLHGEKVAFGVLVQLALEKQPRDVVEQVLHFSSSVGLPVTLAQIGLAGISEEMLRRIAERSIAPGETIHNEPFELSTELVMDAIRAADASGREWRRLHG